MTKQKYRKAERPDKCVECQRPTYSRCEWDEQAVCSSKDCRKAHEEAK